MKRCIIIAAHNETAIKNIVHIRPDDFIICADGGYAFAAAEGIVPNLVVGDFDSFEGTVEAGIEVERAAPEKDDTDTLLCLKRGIERGFDEFIIVGGIGGRLDHTIANLQTVAYGCEQGCFVLLADSKNLVTMIGADTVNLPRLEGYKLSVFAFGDACTGVYEKGVKYPLTNATVTNTFPIGVSNEFEADTATISCGAGKLMIVLSKE
ncbi:thiamine diphosphokinase [Hydrogenoanaerobacterium sp.]|uniref:thiamine diphosphokinase n=1 Tax=Hydrogenoanaerobacterium sp. TaxID=2953763 RepID=UPI00289ABF8F|nr:thiamine diphosphokinase [Hydrogenoanaerobacterium sp.]